MEVRKHQSVRTKQWMKRKNVKKSAACLVMAGLMTTSFAACGDGGDAVDTVADTQVQEVQGEADTADAGGDYQITEENGNEELTMAKQPESSYWFPAQLLEWSADADEDLRFNVSTVPLAERVDTAALKTVNPTQNKETKVMALSIMNSSTSGNAPHGLNKVDANVFSYWQYVDFLVYWGGASGEGIIVPPSPDVTDAAHKNGVKTLGTVFMPPTSYGGKIEWLDDLLSQSEDGSFPVADKLIEVANTYGFDGWFLNQETEGDDTAALTADHATKMQEFISYFKKQAAELELVYYDAMTEDGKMDWQNALTEKNMMFMVNDEGNAVADDMFLNFWWTEEELAPEELLKSSSELAAENNIDPYDLYAGVDIQSDGYATEIDWSLFENGAGGTYTSLGIYCPSWAYFSADTMQDFWKQENKLWVNSKGDPSAELSFANDTEWRGVSTYVVERTPLTTLPFTTNFSQGSGYGFYKNGEQISMLDWNNRSVADVLPTYRYMIDNGQGNSLTADLDVGDAYYGGNSLILRGDMKQGEASEICLYSAGIPVESEFLFTTTARAKGAEVTLDAVIGLTDGTEVVLEGDAAVTDAWTTVTYNTAELAGKTIEKISYRLTSAADAKGLQFRFGNITMAEGESAELTTVTNVAAEGTEFDEDGMYAGVRLVWEADVPAAYYEIYRINLDQTRSLLGVSNTTSFYVNTLPRTDESNQSTFEVVPVNLLMQEGTAAQCNVEWPDNSLPKAAFAADITLVAPGETVTFTSNCSQNTDKVIWTLAGSDKESAEGDTVSVTYQEEGIYDVSVTAENASGSSEASQEGYIVVTAAAADGLQLLSANAPTEADTFVNENEAPEFAVDGDVTKKWCATGSAPHEITIDLGELRMVSAVDVFHAEAGGESADMNTKSYAIMVSEDGLTFEEVKNVTRNTLGTTHDAFTPAAARYVKLVINKPTQGSDSAARIYEVEVYGLMETLE